MAKVHNIRDVREDILNVLKKQRAPIQLLDLSKQLNIRSESDDYDYMRHILTKMCEEGVVMRHSRRRYSLTRQEKQGLTGVVTLYHDNATVATGDPEIPTVHVRRQHLNTALDGDVVMVTPHAVRDGKKIRGEVVAVLERSAHPITGAIEYDGSFHYLIPDEAKYYVDFLVSEKNLKGAKPGDKVIASFVRWEHANASPEASVDEVIGQSGRAVVEFAAILKEFRLPPTFPKIVEDEAAKFDQPPAKAPKGRTDMTKELIVTIDPDDAKDFDDALSLRKLENGNMELGVHIADVSYYVSEESELDKEALKRGNSTYLVDGVVPMLPEHLSNNICSLVPNKTRFAYSVFMEFTPRGIRKSHRIEETLIKSKRRFTYDEVQKILDGETAKGRKGETETVDLVLALNDLAKVLYEKRMKSGGIDFETQEVKFLLDENKMPIGATIKTRTDATSLVEECMLVANQTVAEHLLQLKKKWRTKDTPPLVYRIHDVPDQSKLNDALAVIRAIGIDAPAGKLTPMQINQVLHAVADLPQKPVVHQLMLRSMSKAVYAETNVGHYGLGFPAYAHFTSPIRRYPDLFVHRALKEYAKGKPDERRWRQLFEQASSVADHTSLRERAAVEAERASAKLAQAILAREHLGEVLEGVVTGVTSFGVFVMITSLSCEGLLHIRDLDDDYYIFDEQRMRLFGRRNKRTLAFGSVLTVKIAKVDVDKRMIDLQLDSSGVRRQSSVDSSPAPKAERPKAKEERPASDVQHPKAKRPKSKRTGSNRPKRRTRES
jgi:ribonuclease R